MNSFKELSCRLLSTYSDEKLINKGILTVIIIIMLQHI